MTDEDPAAPARRRLPVAAAVAAVVALLVSGVYVAGHGTQPGEGTAEGSDGDAPARDGFPAAGEPEEAGGATRQELTGPGPDFWGPLHAAGELPQGPPHAAVHRFRPVDEAAVTGLARAFGLDGAVRQPSSGAVGAWTVTGTGPDAILLTVQGQAPGHWSYSGAPAPEDGGGGAPAPMPEPVPDAEPVPEPVPDAKPGTEQGAGPAAGPDTPVSSPVLPGGAPGAPPPVEEALASAGPVLEALGLEDGAVDASEVHGSLRTLRVTVEAGGLPVHDQAAVLVVGRGGKLVRGHGMLAEPVAGTEYPVRSAARVLERRNGTGGGDGLPQAPVCGPAEAAPGAPGTREAPDAAGMAGPAGGTAQPGIDEPAAEPCGPAARRLPVEVTGAVFGLSLHHAGDETVLVPSWRFEGTAEGGGAVFLTHPAVPHAAAQHQADTSGVPGTAPAQTDPEADGVPGNGGMHVEPYDAGDTTLTVHFWAGVCTGYRAVAEETDEAVTVRVEPVGEVSQEPCLAIARLRSAEAELEQPAGERVLRDGHGERLPVR